MHNITYSKAMQILAVISILIVAAKCEELRQSYEHKLVSVIEDESFFLSHKRQLFSVEVDNADVKETKGSQNQLNVHAGIEAANEQVGAGKDSEVTATKMDTGGSGLTHAFVASLSVIIVSELGDKTFFIAAIMAMKHSRLTVLIGALAALFFMTILSALVGYATTVIPRAFTYYASSALFAIFGVKMLREGWVMSADEGQEEYEEVQADLKKREDELEKQKSPSQDIETGIIRTPGRHLFSGILSTIFLQALTLTFLAEWGDRSQLATIILAAREDVYGVIIGGCLGHALCTGLAVLGGRFIAQRISVRTVTLIGGVVFLIFALSAFWIGPE